MAHNNYRQTHGLSALTLNQSLVEAAQGHAVWMAATGKFSHTGENGNSVADRVRAAGYRFGAVGENIAYGYGSVVTVMAGWIKSPGHERNIRGSYQHVGFGVAPGPDGRLYWVANFGAPPAGHNLLANVVSLSDLSVVESVAGSTSVRDDLEIKSSDQPGQLTQPTSADQHCKVGRV